MSRTITETFSSEDNGFFDEAFGNEWKIVREPGVDPAFERANPGDSFRSQLQRHTGAGRFVGSRTVENDVTIPGNLAVAFFDLFYCIMVIGKPIIFLSRGRDLQHEQNTIG